MRAGPAEHELSLIASLCLLDREDVLVDRVLRSEYGRREITDYVITVPETWVGDNYLEDIRRMETTPENAARTG